ncbi:MAG: penicillin-binding protein 2 [Acidimicrobiales bacterium]|jgi:penicillin-binding protein 2|nr:penicillin-binding protein 2 [Acidimicrobiales bacterium]
MDSESPRLRLSILGVIVFSLFVALFARLYFLQVMSSEEGELEATANRVRVVQTEAPRGRILDAEGRVIVDNRTSLVVTVDPHELEDYDEDATDELLLRLAQELTRSGMPTKLASLERRLDDPQYSPLQPIPVAVDVPEELEVILAERAEDFPGVSVRRESVRAYPEGQLAAHVFGYVGRISPEEYEARMGGPGAEDDDPKPYQPDSSIGKTGVEYQYESELRGMPGEKVIEIDSGGKPVRVIEERPPVPGNDLQLTVDLDIQRNAEAQLADQIERLRGTFTPDGKRARAPAGAVTVVDPANGHVLAMASYPTYDPDEFVNGISAERYEQYVGGDAADNPLTNRVIGGLYPPGSTFKLFTAEAAVEKGLITGSTGYNDGGTYTLQGCNGPACTRQNAQRAVHGYVDLAQSLTVSSDVYYYWLGDRFWHDRDQYGDGIQEIARRYGLGAPSGIDLPGELGGLVPDPALKQQRHDANPVAFPEGTWYAGDNVNLAIGQGDVLVTPLQLANAYAAFANGGTLYQPQVVWRILQPKGDPDDPADVVRTNEPVVVRQFDIPSGARDPIERGLAGVVEPPEGTAKNAFEGFDTTEWSIVSKTGTAENSGGKADNAWFVAYAPADDPSYSVAVVLEEAGFGGSSAAPVVRRIFEPLAGEETTDASTSAVVGGND